ncbi:MAG: restriction endonuclease subunit S [bacterium]|nr:restriction endonuclease subunit S [bacterium]
MAVCFTTRKSALDVDLVLDSQFYDPKKLEYLSKLDKQSAKKISDEFSEIVDLTSSQGKTNFPSFVYNLTDSLGNLFSDGEIANSIDDLGSTKKIAQSDDFAISRLRYYLKEFGIVPKREYPPLLSTEYVVLRQNGKVAPHLLLPYLLSSEIQFIFEHSQRGSEHPRLANKDILNLPLPNSLTRKTKEISDIVVSAIRDFEQSSKLYPEAEQELLERMEWNKLATNHVLNYSTTSKDIIADERLDPEFYQPKFEKLEKHLKKVGAMKLGDFCPIPNRGIQPTYDEGYILVINSKHLGPTEIDIDNAEKTTQLFYDDENNKKARIKSLDVLMYSTGAYVGRTNAYLSEQKAIASNHVAIIRPDTKVCNPVYLALFLNSPAGLMQTDQRASGSAQREIYPQDIVKYQVFIPRDKNGKPDLEWQKKLADKVISANKAKMEAKQKLEEAKQLVEKEIERMILA